MLVDEKWKLFFFQKGREFQYFMKWEIGKGFLHIPTCRDDVIWGTYFLELGASTHQPWALQLMRIFQFLSWITWRAFALFYIGDLKLICCIWIVQLRLGITFFGADSGVKSYMGQESQQQRCDMKVFYLSKWAKISKPLVFLEIIPAN